MRSPRAREKLSAAALLAALTAAGSASADPPPSLALDRFDPAPAGDRMFGVESPFVAGHLTPHVALLGDYAHNPLVLSTRSTGDQVAAVVSGQLFLHLNGSLALWNRLNINLDVPVAVLQSGDLASGQSLSAGSQTITSPGKAEFGDLRLGFRYRILGDYHDIFQLAAGGYLWLPTGASDSYVSDGTPRGRLEAIAGGKSDRLVWAGSVGADIRRGATYAGIDQGTSLRLGGGVGFLLGESRRLQIGPELAMALTVAGAVDKRNINAELLVDARYRVTDDIEVGAGVGPGLAGGIGTPDVRGVVMVAYTPDQKKPPVDTDGDGITDDKDACPSEKGLADLDMKKHGCPPPKDRDKDGIIDDSDACPDEPGVANDDPKRNGCQPPKDRDSDGIVDEADACPDESGIFSEDAKKNGCPPPKDTDEDGFTDDVDACPAVKGVADADPKFNGCPPDTDGDTIRDDKDACPKDKGPADPDPKKNGCPTVRVTESEVVILEQVEFDTGKATIKKVSDELLDKVAKVMLDHPELLKMEIQGHTDDRGKARANEQLSQLRADAVKMALVKRKVEAKRLTTKGYGQTVPIASNETEEGRQQNRRVQFKIIDKAPAAGAPDSSAPPKAPAPPPAKAPAPPPAKAPAPPAKAPAPPAKAPAAPPAKAPAPKPKK
ncbi:MAG: OmpA family protein [Byssovorax sp.]